LPFYTTTMNELIIHFLDHIISRQCVLSQTQ
jgi:hypothetical protein